MTTGEHDPITSFEDWYVDYDPVGERGPNGEHGLGWRGFKPCASHLWREYLDFKSKMDARVQGYDVLEKLADGEVISPKPDLPNVSSGELAGIVRRVARNVVQNTPNVEVISCYNDDDVYGIFSRHILTSKVIGSDQYSNDMQQNLFASVKTSFTLGYAAVVPVLLRDPGKGWHIKYDAIHYRDVFPEPGVKDIRDAPVVYVRRYLTRGEAVQLVLGQAPGWDFNALKRLVQAKPSAREEQSNSQQDKKHRSLPDGYEIITRYDNTGNDFLTFVGRGTSQNMLLRMEKNKHPLKQHPVHFLILEKDEHQPLGKSQIELGVGRQDFQDLMLNGAMKLWYRNINPTINIFGDMNASPNFSPGKYNKISNPNARVEPFEVNTQTLLQYNSISQNNLGSMVSLIGAADQQMAQSAGGGNGMSATPQGVDAQQAMVDITTNNYQKAVESFFSHYCSYALTLYFHELAAVQSVKLTADARIKLLEAGLPPEKLNVVKEAKTDPDGMVIEPAVYGDQLDIDFSHMAKEYFVRCVPGSLTELEDEKQLRILNQLFIPLSQAMPALAATQDMEALQNASKAMSYIIAKQIELSGSASAKDIGVLWKTGDVDTVNERDRRIQEIEDQVNGTGALLEAASEMNTAAISQLQEQMSLVTQNLGTLLEKLGVMNQPSTDSSATAEGVIAPGV